MSIMPIVPRDVVKVIYSQLDDRCAKKKFGTVCRMFASIFRESVKSLYLSSDKVDADIQIITRFVNRFPLRIDYLNIDGFRPSFVAAVLSLEPLKKIPRLRINNLHGAADDESLVKAVRELPSLTDKADIHSRLCIPVMSACTVSSSGGGGF